MFHILNFGEGGTYATIEELKRALSESYKGRHVSIKYATKPYGMNRVIYVSVSEVGIVRHSYGDESIVDFIAIGEECFDG